MSNLNLITRSVDNLSDAADKFIRTSNERLEKLDEKTNLSLEAIKILNERIEGSEMNRKAPGRGGSAQGFERKAFNRYLHKNELSALEEKGLSIAGGESAGAGMVPTIIANEILNKAIEEEPILDEIRRTPASSGDYRRIVNRKGSASGWVGENGQRTETGTSGFRTVQPPGGELYAYPKASSWMVQDSSFDVANVVIEDTGEEFATRQADALFFGTGEDQPWGILKNAPVTTKDTTPDTRDRDTIRYIEGSGSPNELDSDLLLTALFDLSAPYRRNAIWCMNSTTLAAARKLKDANGRYMWESQAFSGGVDSPDGLLLGKRVVISERLQNVGSGAGNFSILIGDFRRGYEMVAVGGMFITLDANVTEPGFHKWYIRQRFLGRMTDNNAIRAIRT